MSHYFAYLWGSRGRSPLVIFLAVLPCGQRRTLCLRDEDDVDKKTTEPQHEAQPADRVPALERSPRSQRFLLGDRIQGTALQVLESLID